MQWSPTNHDLSPIEINNTVRQYFYRIIFYFFRLYKAGRKIYAKKFDRNKCFHYSEFIWNLFTRHRYAYIFMLRIYESRASCAFANKWKFSSVVSHHLAPKYVPLWYFTMWGVVMSFYKYFGRIHGIISECTSLFQLKGHTYPSHQIYD